MTVPHEVIAQDSCASLLRSQQPVAANVQVVLVLWGQCAH
jgi:hypothetical protein